MLRKRKWNNSAQKCKVGDQSVQVLKVEGHWVQFIEGMIEIKVKCGDQNVQYHSWETWNENNGGPIGKNGRKCQSLHIMVNSF